MLGELFPEARIVVIEGDPSHIETARRFVGDDVMFINEGRIVLHAGIDALPQRYVELMTSGENAERARRFKPIFEREVFGKKILTFEGVGREELQGLGDMRTPAIADLFVAKVKGAPA